MAMPDSSYLQFNLFGLLVCLLLNELNHLSEFASDLKIALVTLEF
jgi:hypothetical protein